MPVAISKNSAEPIQDHVSGKTGNAAWPREIRYGLLIQYQWAALPKTSRFPNIHACFAFCCWSDALSVVAPL